ncbi:MAG TPA: hypothetical protein PLU67_05300 [Candidatus Kapabacteria bacterium]|jgi:hypothetical protein|nr:hypothetical protein [Candidatus Kapabacteria bacterium]HOM04897.1 hypothetical protein [Candidatus Kapabacteria bacterium]HOQ49280.1 hypothetical protein [Candidatus Kapabacteria bacterium]HPP40378.1 hypothetical protein [Candidatus Kapabacteria bacterium]HPU23598.1 hypothetical protein [Candidatus Kapabacteria bacterium]
MKTNLFAAILGIIIGFALFYMIFGFAKSSNTEFVVQREIFRDTVLLVRPPKEIKVKAKPKIQYSDTIANGFTFSLDTLIIKDTVKITYSYPENNLFLRFAAMPDTFRYERTILNIKQTQSSCQLQDKLLYAVSGIAVGLIISKIK